MANRTDGCYPILRKGHWRMRKLQMKESVVMAANTIVYSDLAGEHTVVGGDQKDVVGILAEPIAAADSDYATAKKLKYVWVPLTDLAEFTFDVGAGTFTNADVGKNVAAHTDSESLAVDTAGNTAVIRKFVTSTKGVASLITDRTIT